MRTLLTSLLTVASLSAHAGLTFEKEGTNLKVLADGELFTEYRTDQRVVCLYPLMSPSGAHLTRQYPFVEGVKGEKPDHPHHGGFWFTHGAVNGKDFWHKENCRIVHKAFLEAPSGTAAGDMLRFSAHLTWEADGKAVLNEIRAYTIRAKGKTRTITVDSRLTPADDEVVFGDTKEGSFAVRVAPTLRLKGEVAKGHILTSEGKKDDDAWGKRARWVAYYGPDSKGEPAVVAILDHSKNLRHPTWWHARNYGLLTANPFGTRAFERGSESGDYTLKKGVTLHQQYQLVLHQGSIESAAIEKHWKQFTK